MQVTIGNTRRRELEDTNTNRALLLALKELEDENVAAINAEMVAELASQYANFDIDATEAKKFLADLFEPQSAKECAQMIDELRA
jgi:hypothetical protein